MFSASMMFTSECLSLVVAVLLLVCAWRFTQGHYWKVRGMPYLTPLYPVFGNMPQLLWFKPMPEIIESVYQRTAGLPYIGIYALHSPLLFVRDFQLSAKILTSDFNHFEDRGFHANENDALSRNLIHQNGDEWRYFRSKITPCFSSNKVKGMFPIMKEKSELMLGIVERDQTLKGVVDVYDVCFRFGIDVWTSVVLGVEANSLENESPFRQIGKTVLDLKIILHFFIGSFFPTLHRWLGIKAARSDATTFFDSVVKEITEVRKNSLVERKDVFQKLLQIKDGQGEPMQVDHDSVVGQIFGLFLAGYESTGNIIACALYELAKAQDIQDTVRQEIYSILSHDEELTLEALNQMKYLHQVVQETLRMYTPLPLIFRRCTKDYTIPGTSSVVEKGTMILIPSRLLLLDPNYYPDPKVFDPDRFTEDNCQTRVHSSAVFMAFGIGPRVCPAVIFSYIEIKTALVYMLRNLEVHISQETPKCFEPDPHRFLLAPKNGLPLTFKKRNF